MTQAERVDVVPAVRLEGVHKHYTVGDVDVHALRGLDLQIEAGTFVSVMGPSGSGKTTLMEILGCLSRPTSGRLWIHGGDTRDLDPNGLARLRGEEIGFIFQSFNLLPRLTAIENVELPLSYRGVSRRERRVRARETLERVGLGHREHHLPSELSGGERQRVAIARALVNRPSLLLAAEPTGNLDTTTGGEILQLLRELHADRTTLVVVTHDPRIGEQAERQIHIRDGQIERDVR
ncbi:MAG: ABC transporter ATP-binding protein [Proteobacteria bacterium]|nr:ABC transporter ATP-binding protein [Pseudomonadota bacterium]